ncbi:MAG: acetyl-CoA carboxylase carboxyltransferase subunit alpha [Clostridia bacterium]|nr:acetyl-CoA carboxylase carboxyltransferase subunit alpha [Clostridia bacterium]
MENNLLEEIKDLEETIKELKSIGRDRIIDATDEIKEAQEKIEELKAKVYKNLTAWDKVELARSSSRPTALDYIDRIFDDFVELHGDRAFKDDKSIVGGLGRIGNQNFTIIAEQKGRNTKENIERNFGMPNPESYRKSIRLMKQAEKFKRPIVTFIDTKGAYPGIGAEERGQGEAIARSMMEMSSLKVPIISIVIGEGSSGGALAIGIGNIVIMLENSVYSILSPEGYASILWKDASRVKEAAEKMKLTAEDLYNFNVIDEIIKEPLGGAEKDINFVSNSIKDSILNNLEILNKLSGEELIENRYQKFRKIGEYQRY